MKAQKHKLVAILAAAGLGLLVCAAAFADNGTETGVADDLTVLGTDGTVPDPDLEVRGFSIFGSTDLITHISTAPGNVIINGALEVSSDVYVVGKSTFAWNVYVGQNNLYVAGGSVGQLLKKNSGGWLEWTDGSALGDNLGNHTATANLDMAYNSVLNVASVTMFGVGLQISTSVYTGSSGIFISTGGAIQTLGPGHGAVAGGARGNGAVDLQTIRAASTQVASGAYSVIAGGSANTASGQGSSVSGGLQNTAAGMNSFIGGGAANYGGGGGSVVGGLYNVANAIASFVPGGYSNTALGYYSIAAGYYSSSTANGTFTWADGLAYPGPQVATVNNVAGRVWFKSTGGFLVTGSTSPVMSGTLNRGMLVTGDGLVGISTGVPYAALDVVSTGTTVNQYAQIWRNSAGTIVSSMTATGVLYPQSTPAGDNLGNHIATTTLQMGNYGVNSSSDITAARYQINGSTVVALLSGNGLGIGVGAGRVVSGGDSDTFVGYAAGYNTTGSGNTFLGREAGYSNTTGSHNVFVGHNAGWLNTTGTQNTFVGKTAGQSNTTGSYNLFSGQAAGFSTDTGYNNVFLGMNAGYYNTAGYNNSFVGEAAGRGNTTATDNSFMGTEAGLLTSAGYNSIMGSGAMYYNTTGDNNSVFGYKAGRNSQSGTANTMLGSQAGFGVSGNSFSSSTLVGYRAGYGLTTGNDNIFLGWQAGYNVTTGTGNIIIGYNKGAPAAGTNNYLNIGGVLYGDLTSGNVGIGDTSPAARLTVGSGGLFRVDSSGNLARVNNVPYSWPAAQGGASTFLKNDGGGNLSWAAATGDNLGDHTATQNINLNGHWLSGDGGNEGISVDASGNVGIGTASPAAKLDVNGSVRLPANAYVVGYTSGEKWFMGQGSYNIFDGNQLGLATFDTKPIQFAPNNAVAMSIINGGNVGIGTASPDQKLYISGSVGSPATSGTTQAGITRIKGSQNASLDIGILTGGGAWLQSADVTGNMKKVASFREA